jgi:hypothetical protein
MNWCWVCSAKNSTESRCSRAASERVDRKERFLLASNGIQKLKTSVTGLSYRQRIASRIIRQFFDGENHHSPLSLDELQKLLPRERRLILLPRMISLVPVLPDSQFISWSTVERASAAIQSISLPALFKALEIQSDADAIVAIANLLGIAPPPKPAILFPPLKKGDRVRRGPDWKWGDQDRSGEGVVTSGCSDRTDECVSVRWDHGIHASYRYSTGAGGFDVIRVDLAAPAGGHFSIGGGHALSSGGAASVGPSAASAAASDWAPGSAVILSSSHAKHADAARGPLRTGDIGRIVTSEANGQVLVRTAAGRQVILPC